MDKQLEADTPVETRQTDAPSTEMIDLCPEALKDVAGGQNGAGGGPPG